jgi:hypothetical protein
MIIYKIGNIDCKINWDDFLSLTFNSETKYKSDFESFSHLYEFIDKNIKDITKLYFNNYEYILENGLLHNLYGHATLRHNNGEGPFPTGSSRKFYIHGRLVSDTNENVRGCKNLESFEKGELFYYTEITNKKGGRDENGVFYRRTEGIDYKKEYIDLQKLRELDKRHKKLMRITNGD